MAIKVELAINKVSRQRIQSLYDLYDFIIADYSPVDNHDHLLLTHAALMHWRLEDMLLKDFKNITLTLNEPEAAAFVLFWNEWHIADKLAEIAVLDIIQIIDKKSKNPRPELCKPKITQPHSKRTVKL